ncbi:uncharacterized protein TM35_000531280, partial [Trypanosoma theileri]
GDQERKTESELGPSAPAGTGRESMAQKVGEGAEEHTGGNHANTTGGVQLHTEGQNEQPRDDLLKESNHVETSSTANNPSVSHSEREASSSSSTISTPAQDVPAPSVTTTATVTSTQNAGEGATAEESTAKVSELSATTPSANTNTVSSESPDQTSQSGPNDPTEQSSSLSMNTTTEAPTTTPSPVTVPNPQINNNITSAVQNKANVDSSVSPVWMRTAAPLMIVVVLFSATVY